ncbi:MAG: hypothetical protein MZV64_19650 [Ignavibacteriales bacterium]|nr:hypothetical protein [Ignavibacteriales bacterium]
MPERTVYRKIIQTGRLAEKLGAQILGLGAFTSVVGDAGVTIAKALDVPVTTGDSYTVVDGGGSHSGSRRRDGYPTCRMRTAAVVGATGAIGQVCAELLADDVARVVPDRPRARISSKNCATGLQVQARSRTGRQHENGRSGGGAVDPDGDERRP